MWARSSRPSLLLLAIVACGHREQPAADPAALRALAARMTHNVPAPGALRDCTPEDLHGTSLTFRSLELLAGEPLSARPEDAEWINPAELDHTPAELRAAKAWVVYKVDLVNAPMALGVKELKIGTVHTRVIRYEASGAPTCALVFSFQNDPAVSAKAIEVSDKAQIDPQVMKVLREDLVAQYLKLAPR
jgi:hypothetical protein